MVSLRTNTDRKDDIRLYDSPENNSTKDKSESTRNSIMQESSLSNSGKELPDGAKGDQHVLVMKRDDLSDMKYLDSGSYAKVFSAIV